RRKPELSLRSSGRFGGNTTVSRAVNMSGAEVRLAACEEEDNCPIGDRLARVGVFADRAYPLSRRPAALQLLRIRDRKSCLNPRAIASRLTKRKASKRTRVKNSK